MRSDSDIVYALAAMVCYGVGDFIYKRAAATGVAAEQFLMGQGWVFCPVTIVYAWITQSLHLGLAGGATPETMLAAQAIVFSTLMTGVSYATSGTIRLPRGVAMHSAAAAAVLIAAFLFLLHGMRHGEASTIVPITQMGFGIAAVLGWSFLMKS